MSSNQRIDRRRVRIGLIQLAVVVTAAVMVFFLDDILRATVEGPVLTVLTPAAPGLGPGSTVWVAGRPVGRVWSVDFLPPDESGPENIVIRAVLQRSVADAIRADAIAALHPAGLLEPVVLSIRPGTPSSPPLDFADTLRIRAVTADQDSVLALGRRLRESGKALAEHAAETRRRLAQSRGTLSKLQADTALSGRLRRDVDTARSLFERDLPNGTLGRLLRDTTLSRSLERLAARLPDLTAPPPDSVVRAGEAIAALAGVRTRIQRLSANLDAGEGTAGRGLRDGELGRQTRLLRARLDSLVTELAAQPRRWLRVRIF